MKNNTCEGLAQHLAQSNSRDIDTDFFFLFLITWPLLRILLPPPSWHHFLLTCTVLQSLDIRLGCLPDREFLCKKKLTKHQAVRFLSVTHAQR